MKEKEKEEDKSLNEKTPEESGGVDESEVLEFEFNEDGEEDLKKTIRKLRNDLKACKLQKEEYLIGWQKERADFVNYKKQEEDRKTNFSEVTRERILTRFLTVLDSFNMAFSNKESWNKVDENWRKGVEYIYSQLNTIFEEYGVKEIGKVGDNFDPNLHQSIEMTTTDNKEKNHKISEIIQKGYKLGDRVIRAARVNVFEYNESTKTL